MERENTTRRVVVLGISGGVRDKTTCVHQCEKKNNNNNNARDESENVSSHPRRKEYIYSLKVFQDEDANIRPKSRQESVLRIWKSDARKDGVETRRRVKARTRRKA